MLDLSHRALRLAVLLGLVLAVASLASAAPSSPYAAFLKLNANPSGLPLSYYVPASYFRMPCLARARALPPSNSLVASRS